MNTDFLQIFSSEEAVCEPTESENGEAADASGEFEALIKGKYRDEYHRRVQSVIDKRFSKMKAMEGALRSYEPLIEHISAAFPHIDRQNTGELISAFLERQEAPTAAADNGKSTSAFIKALEDRIKMTAAQSMRDGLLRDADALRSIYPSFDLSRELSSSPAMKRLVISGVPLRQAFEVTHLEQIMGTALRYAAMKASRDTADILQGSQRTMENSLSHRATATGHRNVNNLTEKDIREILTAVGNGEKVVF